MLRTPSSPIVIMAVSLAVLGSMALAAQDRYTVQVPGGLAFSEFKGYENWQVIAVSQTGDLIVAILGNPEIIAAYQAGVPGNGKPFPDGSKMAKIHWNAKKSAEAPFVVDVPDVFQQAFVIEKDSKRFPKTGGWGYALFNYDAATGRFVADAATADCGHSCHVAVKSKDHIFHPYQKR